MRALTPFLLFCGDQHGRAEEAITLYCSLFEGSNVISVDRYGPDDSGPEGTVRVARFEVGGHEVRAIDSAAPHAFSFNPAVSLWVECTSREELEGAAEKLLDGGSALMPLGDYGFSQMFCWVADAFGVTWQLNLAH